MSSGCCSASRTCAEHTFPASLSPCGALASIRKMGVVGTPASRELPFDVAAGGVPVVCARPSRPPSRPDRCPCCCGEPPGEPVLALQAPSNDATTAAATYRVAPPSSRRKVLVEGSRARPVSFMTARSNSRSGSRRGHAIRTDDRCVRFSEARLQWRRCRSSSRTAHERRILSRTIQRGA